MRSTFVLLSRLASILFLIGSSLYAQTQPRQQAPRTRSDNYLDLRAKYLDGLNKTERERQLRKPAGNMRSEDLDELEFERWDRYWRDHLNASSKEPGKMADMRQHYADQKMAAQRKGQGNQTIQSTGLVCASTGLGNWTLLGPSTYAAPIIGKVTSVYTDPANPNTVYAGASEGGLFKTVNNGASWTNLTDASHFPALGVTSIAVHPTTPTTIYIATRGGGDYGFGILKSTDGGTTWQEVFTLATFDNQANYNIGEGSFVTKLMLHPQNPNYVYALARHYVFRSTDAGATWQKVHEIPVPVSNPDGCGYRLVDIDIIEGSSGVDSSHVIVSTVRSAWLGIANSPCGTAKVFISSPQGNVPGGGALGTFTEITSSIVGGDYANRIATAIQPNNSNEFFVGYENMSTQHFVIKKYNLGGTTSVVGTIAANGPFQLGAGFWNLELQFSMLNANTLYAAGTTAYRISLASGFSSAQISSYWATGTYGNPLAQTHADTRAMLISRSGTNDVVVLGSDGGIHKAVLNPATVYTPITANWDDLSGPGLAINEFFDINGIESNPDIVIGGTQDNGTFEYNNGVWKQRFNYDGWQGTMNQATGEYFGMSNAGPIKITSGTVSSASGPPVGNGPIVSDPNNPAIIYAGRRAFGSGPAVLYKSPDFGASWNTLNSPAGTNDIRVIQVAPSNSQVMYVSRDFPTWNASNFSNRLFKTINGGGNWTDMGVNLNPLAWAAVSDIAIDPDDANRLWVSFNNYWSTSNTSTNGLNRVYQSDDGGSTWKDITYNLPAFPVICLTYRRGSDDEVYAGTDVGIFRFNKSLQSWECFNNQLPVVPVTRLEINYCKNKIRAATYGRGIYESDLPALPSEVVNASVTWSGLRYLSNDLTIAPGATLTLTGTLNMSKDTRIIVQRGATLRVNGGKITNACGEMWYGIEVWGTASLAQNLAAAQGKVILQSSATIENAVEAITTGKDVNTSFDWNYTGGIVQASNSYFYNNRRSAQFMYYHWMVGPNEMNNLSFFKSCTFETNRLLNEPTLLPDTHISLYEVKNVILQNCKFNNTTSTSVFGVNQRGNGVVSYDAQYNVTSTSVFNGLTYGVRADFTAGTNKNVSVSGSSFNNVQRGILVNNSKWSYITVNTFNSLPNALTTNFADATWGMRINNTSGLSVSGNAVTGSSATYQNNYGIIIDNSGSNAGNAVQGNTLKNLYTGIQVQGNNGSGANGVQFRCNVFQATMSYQLAITGTLANQGSTCALGSTADNTFFAQTSPVGSQINSPGTAFSYFASGTVPTNVAGSVAIANCSTVSNECSGSPDPTVQRRAPIVNSKAGRRKEGNPATRENNIKRNHFD